MHAALPRTTPLTTPCAPVYRLQVVKYINLKLMQALNVVEDPGLVTAINNDQASNHMLQLA